MRKLALSVLLASLTFAFIGCGDSTTAPADPTAEGPPLPGAPTEGPEVLKTKSKKS